MFFKYSLFFTFVLVRTFPFNCLSLFIQVVLSIKVPSCLCAKHFWCMTPPSLAAHAGASLGLCHPSHAPLLNVRVALPFTCPSTARHTYSPGAALALRSKSRSVQSALKYLVRAQPPAVYKVDTLVVLVLISTSWFMGPGKSYKYSL